MKFQFFELKTQILTPSTTTTMTYIFNVRREAPLTEADRPLCVYPLKNFDSTYDLEPYYGLDARW